MRRHLHIIASLLSLALGLATAALWVRSGETADWITYETANSPKHPYRHCRASLLSACGWVMLRVEIVRGADASDGENEQWLRNLHSGLWSGLRLTHMDSSWAYIDMDRGVIDESVGTPPATTSHAAVVPIPFGAAVAICLSPWAAAAYRNLRRRNRRLWGLRMRCGYDLRATFARCPECGRQTSAAAYK